MTDTFEDDEEFGQRHGQAPFPRKMSFWDWICAGLALAHNLLGAFQSFWFDCLTIIGRHRAWQQDNAKFERSVLADIARL